MQVMSNAVWLVKESKRTLTELSAHNELDIGHEFVVEHGCIPLEDRRLAGLPVGISRIDGVGCCHSCEMPVGSGRAHIRSTPTGGRSGNGSHRCRCGTGGQTKGGGTAGDSSGTSCTTTTAAATAVEGARWSQRRGWSTDRLRYLDIVIRCGRGTSSASSWRCTSSASLLLLLLLLVIVGRRVEQPVAIVQGFHCKWDLGKWLNIWAKRVTYRCSNDPTQFAQNQQHAWPHLCNFRCVCIINNKCQGLPFFHNYCTPGTVGPCCVGTVCTCQTVFNILIMS